MKAQISPSLNIKTLVTLLALTCVISGCSRVLRAYSGPVLPRESVAVISKQCGILTIEVDGKVIAGSGGRCWTASGPDDVKLHVLPGLHEIKVMYQIDWDLRRSISSSDAISLEFEAKAGHTYHIHSNRDFLRRQGHSWQPSIEDLTGK